MRYLLIVILILASMMGYSQTEPSGFPTQFNTGWQQWGFQQSTKGTIIAKRDTLGWLPRYTGTTVVRPQDRDIYYYDSTILAWKKLWNSKDTLASFTIALNDSSDFVATTKWVKQQAFGSDVEAITADNGLTKTGGNIQLEGTLIKNTTINTTASYFINITGANVGQSLKGTNTSTGAGVMGQSTSGSGVYGLSTSLNGVLGVSASGTGLVGESTSGEALNAYILPSSTNNLVSVVRLQRFTQGTASNGIGGGFDFYVQSSAGSAQRSNRIGSSWTNATTGSRTSILEFFGVNSTVEARKAALTGAGQWVWDGYPALTAQIDTATYKPVAIDGSGNVVRMAGWAGSGGSGGGTLNNVGGGYRWAATPSGDVKTFYTDITGTIDSTSNANGLTYKVDTGYIATQFDLAQKMNKADTVFSTHIAYVDTLGNDATGVVNNPAKPFLTINAALDALPATGGTVKIGIGEFIVPDTSKIKSNIWFAGSGMPHYDDTNTVGGLYNIGTTAITKMVGGTILHGFFLIPFNRNNVDMSDLGVDNGSAWVNANNGGVALDCIGYAQLFGPGLNSADGFHLLQTSANPRTGINVWNVSALVKSPTDMVHAFIFENMINPDVHNIYSCYGFAGIVIKTIGGVYTGLHAMGHSDAGIYLKSNDYSYCYNVTIDGFEITSVGSYDGGGFHINANDAGSPGLYQCVIGNGNISQTKYGIKSAGNVIDNVFINNVNSVLCQGDGFYFPALFYSFINNCSARSCGGDGFNLSNTTGAGGNASGPYIVNCISASNSGDGFQTNGTHRIELENVTAQNNIGYGINSVGTALYIGLHHEISNGLGDISGILNTKLTVGVGGTGNISLTPYAIIAGGTTSTGALQQVSGLGTVGQVLTSNGPGALPSFQDGGAGITTLNTLTATTQTFATGTSGTDFNISSSTSTHTFNIPSASTVNRGLITTTSQTLGGQKTFNDGIVATSGANSRITINGNVSVPGGPSTYGDGLAIDFFTHTNTSAAGTVSANQNFNLIASPTLTSSNAISYTGDVATIRFVGAPIESGSTTISHPYNILANDVNFFGGISMLLNEQSSDATLASASGVNIYTGAGGNTWTLPSLATHPGKFIFIKNAGGGNLTVQRAGSDNIYNTSSVTSITVAAGADVVLAAGSSFWYVIGF